MKQKLLPIEEVALKKGDVRVIISLLQTSICEDEQGYRCGYEPSLAFLTEVCLSTNESIWDALLKRQLQEKYINPLIRQLAGRKEKHGISLLLKNNPHVYLEVATLDSLWESNCIEGLDIYFATWFPVVNSDRSYAKIIGWLAQHDMLASLEARYRKKL